MDTIDQYREELIRCIGEISSERLDKIAQEILDCKGTIYILGNGGSLATAQHFSCDISKNTGKKISTDTLTELSKISAYANDIDYAHIYEAQLRNKLRQGKDIIFNISTSGNSSNLLYATYYSRNTCKIISLLGSTGGELKMISDLYLLVNSTNQRIVEDIHSIICHMLTDLIEKGKRK